MPALFVDAGATVLAHHNVPGWIHSERDSFKYVARPNILQTDAELSGKKRIPQPTPVK